VPSKQHTQADQVWSSLDEAARQEVVDELRRVVKEMIDEHFRIGATTPPESSRDDLRTAIKSKSGRYQQGEPAHAVRAA